VSNGRTNLNGKLENNVEGSSRDVASVLQCCGPKHGDFCEIKGIPHLLTLQNLILKWTISKVS